MKASPPARTIIQTIRGHAFFGSLVDQREVLDLGVLRPDEPLELLGAHPTLRGLREQHEDEAGANGHRVFLRCGVDETDR